MDLQFVCLADFQRTDGRADDLVALSHWLAQVPCGPLYDRHISPHHELAALVATSA